MQRLGEFTPIEDYAALVQEFWRRLKAAHIFQPKYEKDDPKYIRQSTEEHLLHFSNQIVIVEEIKMANLKDGYIPRKLNQWLNNAIDLKSQVSDALKKQQNRIDKDDPSLLKHMCDEIFDKMNDCPIEEVKSFIAPLNETEDKILPSEDGVRGQDVDKEVAFCDKEGRHSVTIRSQSGIVSFLQSYGKPTLNFRIDGETVEGESSQVHDDHAVILEISHKDWISLYIPQPVQESELGMMVHILLIGKMSEYVDLRLQILSTSSSPETSIYLNNEFGLQQEVDKYSFSTMRKAVDQLEAVDGSGENGAFLPKNLIVNRSGSISQEMPTDEEWSQACVVNLIEKNLRLLNGTPNSPYLVILFLQRNSRLTHIPSSFFNQMPTLRFLDLSDTRIKALPTSLFELTNLQVLLLRSCVCLDRLPPEVKNLRNMEVLDILETDLPDLPKEMAELTQLRYLQLSFHQPYSQSAAAIFELQDLQGLSIVVHPNDQQYWMNIVGEIIKEVGELKKLSYLQFYFPSVEDVRYFSEVSLSWKEQRLRSFKFLVGKNVKRIISRVPDEVESKYEQYDRCLRFVNGNEVPEVMKTILKPVTAFYLDHHLKIQSLSEFDVSSFKELRFCVLRECPNIQVMIKEEERTERDFPNLEYLGLYYLWKLEQIWEDPIPPAGSYQALKYLMVNTCGKLECIASHDVLQCLSNLETFIIEDCESLKSIVEENQVVKYDGPLLPRLKELVLRHLPQLVGLGRGLFPSEEIISIHFCPKLILTAGPNRFEWKKLLSITVARSALNYGAQT